MEKEEQIFLGELCAARFRRRDQVPADPRASGRRRGVHCGDGFRGVIQGAGSTLFFLNHQVYSLRQESRFFGVYIQEILNGVLAFDVLNDHILVFSSFSCLIVA
jgi:hypothetical protein